MNRKCISKLPAMHPPEIVGDGACHAAGDGGPLPQQAPPRAARIVFLTVNDVYELFPSARTGMGGVFLRNLHPPQAAADWRQYCIAQDWRSWRRCWPRPVRVCNMKRTPAWSSR